jgi:hypothetical protein
MTLRTTGGRIWRPTPKKPPGVSIVDEKEEETAPSATTASGDKTMSDEQAAADSEFDGQSGPPPGPRVGATPDPQERHERSSSRRASANGNGASAGVGAAAKEAVVVPYSREGDTMWGELCSDDHPRCLKALGLTPFEVYIDVRLMEGKVGSKVHTIPGRAVMGNQNMSPAQQIYETILEQVHTPLSNGKPAIYEIDVRRLNGSTWAAKGGVISYPSTQAITAMRRSAHEAGVGYAAPQGQYVPPVQLPGPQYMPPPPQPQPQQRSQPQEDPSMNQGGNGGGWPRPNYGGAPQDHQPPYRSTDPEVSQLRTELGELRGMLREVVDTVRTRGASPGVGAAPPTYDARDEELADLRAQLGEMRTAIYMRPGATPPAAPMHSPPPQVVPVTRAVPQGPNGEVYVEGHGWMRPANMQPAMQPAVIPLQPERPTGVGSAPVAAAAAQVATPAAVSQAGMEAAMQRMQSVMIDTQTHMMTQMANRMSKEMTNVLRGLGAAPPEREPEPEPEEEEDKPELPFDVMDLPAGTTLFGQPAKYAADRKTGNISVKGVIAANPVLVEKGVEAIGKLAEPIADLIKRAAMNTGANSPGVGAAPTQELPAAQQPSKKDGGGGQQGGAPAAPAGGAWPEV